MSYDKEESRNYSKTHMSRRLSIERKTNRRMHMWLLKQQNSSKIFVDVEDDGSWLCVVDNVVWQSDRIQMES